MWSAKSTIDSVYTTTNRNNFKENVYSLIKMLLKTKNHTHPTPHHKTNEKCDVIHAVSSTANKIVALKSI